MAKGENEGEGMKWIENMMNNNMLIAIVVVMAVCLLALIIIAAFGFQIGGLGDIGKAPKKAADIVESTARGKTWQRPSIKSKSDTDIAEESNTTTVSTARPTEEAYTPAECPIIECAKKFSERPLVIIAIGGLPARYKNELKTLIDAAHCGVSSTLIPVFPAKTLPMLFTIATGRYPESHGLVDSAFFDPEKKFFINGNETKGWIHGEPIWETAKKNGLAVETRSWPRNDMDSQLLESESNWVNDQMHKGTPLIMIYFNSLDTAVRRHGWTPSDSQFSKEAQAELRKIETKLKSYMDRVRTEYQCVNTVIISDHGTMDVNPVRNEIGTLNLAGAININSNTTSHYIFSRKAIEYSLLALEWKHFGGASELSRMFSKATIPIRYHYTESSRIGDILKLASPGTRFFRTDKEFNEYGKYDKSAALDGYDPLVEDMQGIFIAFGPSINRSSSIRSFETIELYNLFTRLLGIEGAPNNGATELLDEIINFTASDLRRPSQAEEKERSSPYCFRAVDLEKRCKCTDLTTCIAETEIEKYNMKVPYRQASVDISSVCKIQLQNLRVYYDLKKDQTVLVETYFNSSSWRGASSNTTFWQLFDKNGPIVGKCAARTRNGAHISLFGGIESDLLLAAGQLKTKAGFANGIWRKLLDKIGEYIAKFEVVMYSGPIFKKFNRADYKKVWESLSSKFSPTSEDVLEADGINDDGSVFADIEVAVSNRTREENVNQTKERSDKYEEKVELSHVFVILARCTPSGLKEVRTLSECILRPRHFETLAFVLPNVDVDPNFNLNFATDMNKVLSDYLLLHRVRIRDIELLTGVDFFPWVPTNKMIWMKLQYPTKLW